MTVSKIATYVSFVVLVMASFILAPGSAGHAGDRARTIRTARSSNLMTARTR